MPGDQSDSALKALGGNAGGFQGVFCVLLVLLNGKG